MMRKLIIILLLFFIYIIHNVNALTLEVQGNTVGKPVVVKTDKEALIIFRINNGTPIYAYGTSAKFIPYVTGNLLIEAIADGERVVKIVKIVKPTPTEDESPGETDDESPVETNIYWEGTVYLPDGYFTKTAINGKEYKIKWRTALGALEMASRIGGFSYTIKETQWGPFVECIAGKCAGSEGPMSGWMYWVNYPREPLPGVSADKYEVKSGDVVYWYFVKSMEDKPESSSMVIKIHVKYKLTYSESEVTSEPTSITQVYEAYLTSYTPTTINISKHDIMEITLVSNESGYCKINIQELKEPKVFPNVVGIYKFLKIDVDKPIINATIKFRVPISWIDENGYNPNYVALMKYDRYWVKLPTKLIGNDSQYYYFSSNVTSFSIFVIAVTRWDNYPLNVTDKPILKALSYLKSIQHDDGGFGEEESNFAKTCWVIMALVSAKQDPHKWIKNGSSPIDYLRMKIKDEIDKMGTAGLARTILALVAAGEDPRNFSGIDLVSKLKEKVKPDGQIGDFIYTTIWGIIALSACGENVSKSVEWLIKHQNEDGGFGWAVGAKSDYDDTAAAIQALIAGGIQRDSEVIKRALEYLKTGQNDDGGFRYFGNGSSNAASDAWVIQALVAAGENPMDWRKNNTSVVEHLLSLQTEEGYFKYTKYEVSNPCYMTACAIMALLGKYHPIMPEEFINISINVSIEEGMEKEEIRQPVSITPTPKLTPTPLQKPTPTPSPTPTYTPTPITTKEKSIPSFTVVTVIIALLIALWRVKRW